MNNKFLHKIDTPADVKKLSIDELKILAEEIREYIIHVVSDTGGHLAPSLGAVEITLAVHYVFDSPKDKIIWDVGHQAYAHKIITERREAFASNRCWEGISGFPKRSESPHDAFGVGHASTSISAGLGIAAARDALGEKFSVVSIIGDGSMTGGLAFEGLNNAGASGKDMLVILNDNQMSISPNVGALHNYLTMILTHPTLSKMKDELWDITGKLPSGEFLQKAMGRLDSGIKALMTPGLLFESLGFDYLGPVNGHDIETLVRVLTRVKDLKGPNILHVLTQKGRGYKYAEEDATRFHGLGAFDKSTGETNGKGKSAPSYTSVFGETMVELGSKNDKLIGITAAMGPGTGLSLFQKAYPKRFFDVGIAEGHAVTFAAGLAVKGMRPVVAIYSTFFQRALDQMIHDVALQKLPVVFALDRAGLVGEDGPTHHGCFDLSYLRSVPNLVIMAPRNEAEMQDMLHTAVQYEGGPVVIRYPRSIGEGVKLKKRFRMLPMGKGEILRQGANAAIVGVGPVLTECLKAAEILSESGIDLTVVDMKFVKPMDRDILKQIAEDHRVILTVEENSIEGGFGSGVMEAVSGFDNAPKVFRMGIPDMFIEHGPRAHLLKNIGLTAEGISSTLKKLLQTIRIAE